MTRATELVLEALRGACPGVHLDTADRRGLSNVGKFELGNLLLAARHGWKFLWLLLTRQPGVVYVPISQAWLPFLRDCLFLIPARLSGRKVVIHLHGGYFGRFYRGTSRLMRWIIRFALGNASCAIVLGQRLVDVFDGILPACRIRVIPNGIPDGFAGWAPKEGDNRVPTVLYLSTLTAEKGFLDLLRVLPQVRERVGNFRTVFAGEWYSQRDRITAQQLIDHLELGKDVEFVGAVGPDRKRQLLQEADLFAFPTAYRYEGHPYVILEAMAAGLPIVSTNVACIPETVRDGIEGFLVEPGDLEGLASQVGRLLADKPLRQQMAKAARRRFLAEYTCDQFAEKIRAALADAVRNTEQG